MAVTGAGTISCLKRRFLKCFVQCHVFIQSLTGRHPCDKYPVNSSHRLQLV